MGLFPEAHAAYLPEPACVARRAADGGGGCKDHLEVASGASTACTCRRMGEARIQDRPLSSLRAPGRAGLPRLCLPLVSGPSGELLRALRDSSAIRNGP